MWHHVHVSQGQTCWLSCSLLILHTAWCCPHSLTIAIHLLPDRDRALCSLGAAQGICHTSHRHLAINFTQCSLELHRRCLSSCQFLRQVHTLLSWVPEMCLDVPLPLQRMSLVWGRVQGHSTWWAAAHLLLWFAVLRGAIALPPSSLWAGGNSIEDDLASYFSTQRLQHTEGKAFFSLSDSQIKCKISQSPGPRSWERPV